MTNEPERPIEQLLRAAANTRRQDAGAPLDLHPADRRMLQGEVSRHFGRASARQARHARQWAHLWPRLAWGGAIFAGLVIAMVLLLPSSPDTSGESEMALASKLQRFDSPSERTKEPWPPTKDTSIPSPAAAPVAAASAQTETKMLLSDGYGSRRLEQNAAPAAAPEPAKPRQSSGGQLVASTTPPSSSAAVVAETPALAYSAPAPSTPSSGFVVAPKPAAANRIGGDLTANKQIRQGFAGTSQPQLAGRSRTQLASANAIGSAAAAKEELSVATAESRLVQRYFQAGSQPQTETAAFEKTKAVAPVLSSFQVELRGRELKVIDGDGSVYSGQVQSPRAAGGLRASRTKTPAAAPAPTTAQAAADRARTDLDQLVKQDFSFRVTGTNRTLRKRVVFTGDLVSSTNVFLWRQPAGTATANAPADSNTWKTLPLRDSRITGKVVVGNGKALPVDALPAKP